MKLNILSNLKRSEAIKKILKLNVELSKHLKLQIQKETFK